MHCYCGSNQLYRTCCQPLHNNEQQAHSAEALMRSRFSAFCTRNYDYLIKTLHPSKRQQDDVETLKLNFSETKWLSLQIIGSTDSSVEFVAFYKAHPFGQLHEESKFIQENERWFYLDGTVLTDIKIGRNITCPCGSGKKFKHCCA